MDTTKLVRLKQGASAKWGKSEIGYTRGGISITLTRTKTPLYNQRKLAPVDVVLTEYVDTVSIPAVELNTVVEGLLNETGIPTNTLTVYGETVGGTLVTYTLQNAYLDSIETYKFEKTDETVFNLVFKNIEP